MRIFAALLLLLCASAEATPVQFVNVTSFQNDALFTLIFEDRPDFFTVDEYGRPKDSFQFFVDPHKPFLDNYQEFDHFADDATLIRGDELSSGRIPIRLANHGPNFEPGAIVDEIGFALLGRLLLFAVPLDSLFSDNGFFHWTLETYHYGATDSFIADATPFGIIRSVPEPSTLLLMFGGLALIWLRGRSTSRSPPR